MCRHAMGKMRLEQGVVIEDGDVVIRVFSATVIQYEHYEKVYIIGGLFSLFKPFDL